MERFSQPLRISSWLSEVCSAEATCAIDLKTSHDDRQMIIGIHSVEMNRTITEIFLFYVECMNFEVEHWKQTMNNLSESIVEKEYNWLIEQIEKAHSSNPSKLRQILYQIDIEEAKLAKVFTQSPSHTWAKELADLMIQRELKKRETRRKYRCDEGDGFFDWYNPTLITVHFVPS